MAPEPKADMERNRAHVLIIEDDPRLARVMARVLAEEHDVTVLTSAQEGLDRIAGGERFDLILCDLMMPEVTGMDFFERLPASAPELVERVVFITGGAYTPRAQAFLAQAAIPPIEKPFQMTEFRLAVRAHLRRRAAE
jgi:DNA-binding response OmpR family regulator